MHHSHKNQLPVSSHSSVTCNSATPIRWTFMNFPIWGFTKT